MAQSVVVRGRDPDGNSADLNLDEAGNLKIAGTFSFEPPVGAATEAKQTAQIAQVGEVQASPTQYTLLDRLKTLATLLSAGLPAAFTAGGGVKTGLVDALPAGENALGKVGSNTSVVGVEFTRPSDTTAYAARDVVCNSTSSPSSITFADFARVNQGSGIVIRARLFTDKKDVTAQFRLHLFHTAPTAIADNSPYTLLYVNAANRIGQVDFPAMGSEDPTNSTASAAMRPAADGSSGPPNLWYQAASGSRAIYGVLETLSAFTPASGQKCYIQLAAIND